MAEAIDQQNAVETPVRWPLIKAIEEHDEEKVKRLIAENIDVNEVDDQRRPPLICAVENNVDLNIIKALVEDGGAPINANDPRYNNRTVLFYAVTKSKEIASYLFGKACEDDFNKDDVPRILAFFIENLCTTRNRHDSGPTVDDIFHILQDNVKDLTPTSLAGDLAKSIANVLLCKSPLFLASDSQRPKNSQHSMFHLHDKRNFLLDTLKKVSDCEGFDEKNYRKKKGIEDVIRVIPERRRVFSDILVSLKEHGPDSNFADSYGNTALHYAACLPWMGVPYEPVEEICTQLRNLGVPPNAKNNLGQTPLLFCLSGSMRHLEEEDKVTAMMELVEVCKFLVNGGSLLSEASKNGESVFHLVMKLFQQGLEIPDQTNRQSVINKTLEFLYLLTPNRVGKVVQKRDDDFLNTPLHLWASLALTVRVKDYASHVTTLLKVILKYLTKCGAKPNDRNNDEETPLHMCTTWTAVTLLIKAGGKRNDLDSQNRPPLLAAASKKTFLRNPSRFYPDYPNVQEDAKSFFKKAIEEKLDLWAFSKCDESVLGFLIASDTYDLSKALVEVACSLKEKHKCREIFVSLLKAICKDVLLHTRWKIELVQTILECAKERKMNVVKEPFDVCCDTLSQLSNGPHSPSSSEITEESGEMNDYTLSNNRTAEQSTQFESTIHWQIAKMLRSHGAELSGQSYETLKTKCSEIDNILRRGTEVQVLLPWTSRSKRHKPVLEKVARWQECHEIRKSPICCHRLPNGSFGVDPVVGINKQNSREVSIKRIGEAQCTQDLKNLYAELDCEQIIRYFLHVEDNEDEIVYIVFELMEGNLDDYLKSDAFDSSKATRLCQDIVEGLNYLHKNDVSHFQNHLKPTSIFYKTHPDLCLKLTDFDDQPTNGTSNFVWSSPEVLEGGVQDHCKSDVFCCGLLLHYILSKGKHPFGTNRAETESNIRNNKMEEWDDSLVPEGTHLVKKMLGDKGDRPTIMEALNHPLFWSKVKKVDFLFAVGNQPVFEYPRAGKAMVLTAVETELEEFFGTIVKLGEWNDAGYKHMGDICKEMKRTGKRKYDTSSLVELVRLIRNAYAHVSEDTRPTPIRKLLLEDFVFLEYFPNLVMEVYNWAVTTHGWDQTKEEIKYTMKK